MAERNSKPAIVLLVEDDPGDQELTRRALQDDILRTTLYVVSDGEEAMDFLLRRGNYSNAASAPRPDLMLLDLNMPKLDGRQVLYQVRENANLRRLPVVVLTTSKQEEDIIRSYDLGCNSFITKPVEVDAFMRTVRGLGAYWFELVTLPKKHGEL
jgi:two-component system, chemotaxis family, response regulator Rcp1